MRAFQPKTDPLLLSSSQPPAAPVVEETAEESPPEENSIDSKKTNSKLAKLQTRGRGSKKK